LKELLAANTELTEKVEAMSREIHARLVGT
jgi:hypothetical protein